MTFDSGIKNIITLQLKYMVIRFCKIDFTILNEIFFHFQASSLVL
jgi:hypothetical protein